MDIIANLSFPSLSLSFFEALKRTRGLTSAAITDECAFFWATVLLSIQEKYSSVVLNVAVMREASQVLCVIVTLTSPCEFVSSLNWLLFIVRLLIWVMPMFGCYSEVLKQIEGEADKWRSSVKKKENKFILTNSSYLHFPWAYSKPILSTSNVTANTSTLDDSVAITVEALDILFTLVASLSAIEKWQDVRQMLFLLLLLLLLLPLLL